MTHFDYYATTSDKYSRLLQYGGYPLAELAGYGLFKNNKDAANVFAKVVCAALYSGLTTTFFGRETNMIDLNSREAVSAAMGIDADKVKFSDYSHASNVIAKKASDEVIGLQKYRYGTDAMFLMPLVAHFIYKAATGRDLPPSKVIRSNAEVMHKGPKTSFGEFFGDGHNLWNFGVFAGKAAYWGFETFFIDKSAHYEVVKLKENLESTGKDLSANDLLGVYQRMRNHDRKLEMIETAQEYDALRPLLKQMTEAYNKHDGKFGMSEIVYLIGENKVNIHAPDNKSVSQETVAQSAKDIQHVIEVGLSGIREENRKLREQSDAPERMGQRSFRDQLTDGAFNAVQTVFGKNKALIPKRAEEWITVRDPGELTNWTDTNHRSRG